MRRVRPWHFLLVAGVGLVAAIIVWRIVSGGAPADDQGPAPSALVSLASVRSGQAHETVEAYGSVTGSAASSQTLAVPRAVIVERVLTPAGTPVAAGATLAVLVDAPASAQAYRQAADAATFAEKDLARVQRLFAAHLAANDQLLAAQKALADARAALAAQTASGAGAGRTTLKAPFAGVVTATPVTSGEHVAADAPLMTLAKSSDLVVQLGVEPEKAARLAAGQAVTLIPVFHPERTIATHLSQVGRQVDPATRLVVALAPLSGAGLAIGESARARITVSSHAALLVPRTAVVFDEDGAHLFVISGGKAHQVAVKAGAEDGDDLEVSGPLKAADAVVVQGAYQLQDGMAVRVAKP
jgi:RND family efflux transporter MFP subunit